MKNLKVPNTVSVVFKVSKNAKSETSEMRKKEFSDPFNYIDFNL